MAVSKQKAVVSELRVSVQANMPFDQLVAVLKETLTIPELPGVRGCRPCLSGLDKFILEDIAMRGVR
jgi:hypothetical protein